MKISVLMTLYNGEKYLIEQLESIYEQTRKPDEVLICDDGSRDNSVGIAEDFIVSHGLFGEWKIQVNEKNLGYAENFFQNMRNVHGDVVFFCDQDDIWYKNKLEECCDILESHTDAVLLCSEFDPYLCSEDAPEIPRQFMRYINGSGRLEKLSLNAKTIFIGSEGCVMCVRKDFFNEILPYHFTGWAHDEYVWKMALAQNGCYYYHKPLIRRRMHSANVSKKKMRDKTGRIAFLERLKLSHERMLEYAQAVGMDLKKQKIIEENIEAASLRINLLKEKRYADAIKLGVFHLNHYQSIKSIPVELYMALKK